MSRKSFYKLKETSPRVDAGVVFTKSDNLAEALAALLYKKGQPMPFDRPLF